MFKGIYKGKNAKQQNKKILILGESHYDKSGDDNFTTSFVVNNYHLYPKEQKYRFFHKIAQCFSIDTNEIDIEFEEFWDNVYFANYVDDLCGIKNTVAKNCISKNRQKYNDELFSFINERQIDAVFVFGKLVYNNLPSFFDYQIENNPNFGNIETKDYITHCMYVKNKKHKNTDVILKQDVHVYGIKHPSAIGFSVKNYKPYLKNLL